MALSRRSWIAAGTGAAVLALLLAWAFAPRPVAVEVAQAAVARFETTIDEDARTRLVDRYTVSAPLAGRLERIALREGDTVTIGQPVAALRPVLSPMLDERTRAEQRARIDAAQASLERAGTRVESAQVTVELARNELRRTEQLAAQGFVAPTQVERERLALRSADKELEAAAESRKVARYEVELARAALAAVNRASTAAADAPFTVKAPVAGRVLRVHQASEAVVGLGAPLIDLGDTARLEVVAELLTTDALQATPGSAVRIERWGGPGLLEGRVSRVEPAAFTKVSALGVEEQRVNVHIALTSAPAQWQALGDGYRVAVRIVTRSVERALQVPLSAVFPLPGQAEGQAQAMAVFTVEGGRARLRPVKLGARGGGTAWITEGLEAGATVIVYPPAGVEDGVRIEERQV